MAKLGRDFGVLLLVLLPDAPLVLVQVGQLVQADGLELLGVGFDLFGRVLELLHEGSPGPGDVASWRWERKIWLLVEFGLWFAVW